MMSRSLAVIVFGLGILGSASKAQQGRTGIAPSTFTAPRAFIENRGQWSNGSLFQMRRGNSVVAVQRDGFTIQMLRIGEYGLPLRRRGEPRPDGTVRGWNLRLRFLGANPSAIVEGVDELPGVHNWLRGSDPSGWVTKVHGYSQVRIRNLYPGIDLRLYERDAALEYDLDLHTGADPSRIALHLEGIASAGIDATGDIVLSTPWQDVVHSAAACRGVTAADGELPNAEFRQRTADVFNLDVRGWGGTTRLTIDPTLVYSTYLGGDNGEVPYALSATNGRVIVGGETLSYDFPLSAGAFQSINHDFGDGFVTSLTPDGSQLVFSTLFGGSGGDSVKDIAIDDTGLPIAVGLTSSADFPSTDGAYDEIQNGQGQDDAFVARLSGDGSDLVFSTFLGGSDHDPATRVVLGADESIYVAGQTESLDFPTTPNALASTFGASITAFAAHFSSDGSQLLASTMLGGTADSEGRGLGVDGEGNVFVGGRAHGNANVHIPVTPGAFDTTANGSKEAFVAKFTPDLSALVYCTYIGGDDFDDPWGMALASDGSVCIAGQTLSSDFPTTPGVFQKTNKGPPDGFVSMLDPTGSSLVFSTYMGGFSNDEIDEVKLGPDGSIFLAGDTTSSPNSFPVTPDGWDITKGGGGDTYLVRLTGDGKAVTYGTYIGGNGSSIDECRSMALDESGNAFVAGEAFSTDFPVTPGAFDSTLTDFKDCFVVRFAFAPWAWSDLGFGLPGAGVPKLTGNGTLQPGSAGELKLSGVLPVTSGVLVTGLTAINAPFKGGTLVPAPVVLLPLVVGVTGEVVLSWTAWPVGVPSGTTLDFQAWFHDPFGPKGWSASNALLGVTP